MSTTPDTPNTLIDISCPNKSTQQALFELLCKRDALHANPINPTWDEGLTNKFLHYGQFHLAILNGVDEVRRSTNPIHVSNGLFSDSFVFTEGMKLSHDSTIASDAIRGLKKEALSFIRIIHLHIHPLLPTDITRRMALNLWHVSCPGSANERWLTFNTSDIGGIEKGILECLKEMEPKPESD